MNDYPSVAKISNDCHVRENTFLDTHDLNHMSQVIGSLLNIVFYLNIVVHNLVL